MKMNILKHFGLAALLALGANAGAETVAKIGTAEYETIGEALAAVKTGETVEIVKAGEYVVDSIGGAGYSVVATVDGVVFKRVDIKQYPVEDWISGCSDTVTLSNLTWKIGTGYYSHFKKVHAIDCRFEGRMYCENGVLFDNCTFVKEPGDYPIYTYHGGVTFNQCTFDCGGKCINVYSEIRGGDKTPYVITVNGCTFKNSGVAKKAAILVKEYVDGSSEHYFDIILQGTQTLVGEFPSGSYESEVTFAHGDGIVAVEAESEAGTGHVRIFEGDKPVYPVVEDASETKVEVTEPIVAKGEKGEVITGDDAEAAQQAADAAVAQIVANKGAAMTEGTGVEAAVFASGEEVKQDVVSGLQAAANDVVKDDKGTALSEAEKTEVQQKVAEIATSKDVSSYVKIDVKSPAVKVEDKVATVKTLVYDVQPMAVSKITTTADTANPKTVTVEAPVVYNDATKPIKFRLPLTDAFTVSAIVTHEGDPDRLCMVQGTAGALYVEVSATHFSLFSVAPSDIVETSASSKTVLGIKRIDYTVTQTTADLAAAVPWLKAADADMPVAQLISTGLGEGDQIQVYDLEKKTYYSWHYVGTSWTADALSTGGSSPSAETCTLKRGRAFWYKPAGGKGTAGTYTQVGLYSEASITSKVDSATVASASFANPVHFLMASPKYEDVNLKEKLTYDAGCRVDDVVVIVATGARYRFNGSVWGQDKVVEKVSRFDGETYTTSEFAEVTGDIVVPAGTAFWYLSAGGAPEFEW